MQYLSLNSKMAAMLFPLHVYQDLNLFLVDLHLKALKTKQKWFSDAISIIVTRNLCELFMLQFMRKFEVWTLNFF